MPLTERLDSPAIENRKMQMNTIVRFRDVSILYMAIASGCVATDGTPQQPGSPRSIEPVVPVVSVPAAPVPTAKPSSATKNSQTAPKAHGAEPRVTSESSRSDNPPAAAKSMEPSPSPPSLDLATLKTRLRQTGAIGVLTKLSLQNQVEDLLDRFRAHHRSGQQANVTSLRQPYDMLVLKVLALVQDSDPALARTIAGSREALWGVLADPQKFSAATI